MLTKCGLLCTILAAGALSASAAITVSFDPVNTVIVAPAGTALVNIVADIPQEDAIVAWGMDLDVADLNIATWNLVSISSFFDVFATPDGDGLGGIVNIVEDPAVWGNDVLLATVQFTGVNVGITGIQGSDDYPTDLTEGFARDYPPNGWAEVIYEPGTVEVLPEPASLLLLVLAAAASRRR